MQSISTPWFRRALFASGLLSFSVIMVAAPEQAGMENPLLVKSPLPFGYPQFDQIDDADFAPAFRAAMAEDLREVEAITANPAPPTFANTIVALEQVGETLDRARRIFGNLVGADTNPVRQQIDKEFAPIFAAHYDTILLNPDLFARVAAIFEQRESLDLDDEARWLVQRTYEQFVRAGAKLSGADRERLKAMNAEIATLQTAFSQNVLDEVNASAVLVESRERLAGWTEQAIQAAAKAATAAGHEGKFLIRLQNTTGQPPLAQLQDRSLREEIHRSSVARGSRGGDLDNRTIVSRLARLRAERAQLLGFENHAAFVLADQTAGTIDAVEQLLKQLAAPAVANARQEARDLQAMIDREGGDFQLQPWDWAYYAEQVRRERFSFDEDELRPYFELNRVLHDGVFFAAEKLFGLRFVERTDLPVYHPDVRVWEVREEDGRAIGLFLGDFYARPSKRGGAWMSSYQSQSKLLGHQPIIANHLNVPKPPEGEPTLLTYDEANTLFHEFGHALHGLLSDVTYPRFSGTRVPRDFVEFPSQVNEMWLEWPEVLQNFARHHETGEPMPAALLEQVLASQKFNQGYATTEYLAASFLDQAWHQLAPDEVPDAAGVLEFEASALQRAGLALETVPPRYRSTYFSHIFSGGYSSGYYAYIWAEVLDADAVEWFRTHGGLTRANGDHYRKTVLSRGGSTEAMNLYRNFAGRDPEIEPLLERRGLKETDAN